MQKPKNKTGSNTEPVLKELHHEGARIICTEQPCSGKKYMLWEEYQRNSWDGGGARRC